MRDIRQYLHLYLGCHAEAAIHGVKYSYVVKIDYDLLRDADWIKPILRPLSSMTEEEARDLIAIRGYKEVGEVRMLVPYGVEFDHPGFTTYLNWEQLKPEAFLYLISKSFDLFDLIPNGLAIEKQP